MDYIVGGNAVLSDEELRFLSETTPFLEGGGLHDFQEEMENLIKAVPTEWKRLQYTQAKWLYLLRGFYFLGVLRGGEAYRNTLLDRVGVEAADIDPLVFRLDAVCAQLFQDDLTSLTQKELKQICSIIGM